MNKKSKEKPTIFQLKNRKAQEEMIGFALIMIITIVILVILLSFSLSNSGKEVVESYEVESFIQASLQYTSNCKDSLEYLSIQKLIFDCQDGALCIDGRDTCDVLNSSLVGIVKESWKVGVDRPILGYELEVFNNEEIMLLVTEGNITRNYEGSMQDFSRRGENYELSFKAYY